MEPLSLFSATRVSAVAAVPTRPAVMTEDRPSLRALFDSEESALLRFAYGICGQRETAEDIVQEAFLRLHEHWDEVQNPLAWLYRSIRNLALNHIRDHRKESPMQDGEEWQSESPMASEVLGKMEAVGVLRTLMADMHDEDRNIIDLKYHGAFTKDRFVSTFVFNRNHFTLNFRRFYLKRETLRLIFNIKSS
jgi:RNA polymerase sigma-70 factor (ECF subfamily)